MLTVGLEPTRANTVHLKCTPLDRSGNQAKCMTFISKSNKNYALGIGIEPMTS